MKFEKIYSYPMSLPNVPLPQTISSSALTSSCNRVSICSLLNTIFHTEIDKCVGKSFHT